MRRRKRSAQRAAGERSPEPERERGASARPGSGKRSAQRAASLALALATALALFPEPGLAQADAKERKQAPPAAAPAKPAKASPARGAAGAQAPTWYALTLAHSELGLNVAYFWSKGAKLHAETVVAGHKIVSLVNGDTYYAYDATSREGVAIGRAPEAMAKDAPGRRPFGREVEVIVGQGGEKVGEEEIGGRACERYRVTDGAGRREVWVTKDELRLPVRLEIYTRLSGRTIHTDFVNWAAELPIDDGFFEPDPGVKFTRLTYREFAERQFTPIGPVPILYMDLLTGR